MKKYEEAFENIVNQEKKSAIDGSRNYTSADQAQEYVAFGLRGATEVAIYDNELTSEEFDNLLHLRSTLFEEFAAWTETHKQYYNP